MFQMIAELWPAFIGSRHWYYWLELWDVALVLGLAGDGIQLLSTAKLSAGVTKKMKTITFFIDRYSFHFFKNFFYDRVIT